MCRYLELFLEDGALLRALEFILMDANQCEETK